MGRISGRGDFKGGILSDGWFPWPEMKLHFHYFHSQSGLDGVLFCW